MKYIDRDILVNLHHRPLKPCRLIVLQNTPTAIKILFPWQLTFSSPHPLHFNMLAIFSSKNIKRGHTLALTYLYGYLIMHTTTGTISKIY